jgi:hypothetical protein
MDIHLAIEVAAIAKLRFGQVAPGTEQNQWSHTANFLARTDRIGKQSG